MVLGSFTRIQQLSPGGTCCDVRAGACSELVQVRGLVLTSTIATSHCLHTLRRPHPTSLQTTPHPTLLGADVGGRQQQDSKDPAISCSFWVEVRGAADAFQSMTWGMGKLGIDNMLTEGSKLGFKAPMSSCNMSTPYQGYIRSIWCSH